MEEKQEVKSNIKYKKLYLELKEAIEEGRYLSGSLLPTEAKLMEENGYSRTTVRRAMALLQEDGLVKISQGRGAEVIKGKSQVRQTDYHISHDVIGVNSVYLKEGLSRSSSSVVELIPADREIAELLGVAEQEQVYRIQRLKTRGEEPFDYVVSYVPTKFAPGLEQYSGQIFWLHKCLNDNYHITATGVRECIYADVADFVTANLLHVSIGSPLIIIERKAEYEDSMMEYTRSYIRPDVFRIELSMAAKPDYLSTEGEASAQIISLL